MTHVSSNSPRPRPARDAHATFVLVHGVCTSSLMWAPLQRELALLGHRSLAVDLPGHGFDAQYSAAYQAPQDLDAWAAEPSKLAGVTLQDNVDMVAGYVASPDAVGARDYLDQNAMPTLIANAGANVLSRAKKSSYIYRTSFSNWQPSHPMGAYVAENISKKVTLLYANYAAGSEAAAAFKETFTGTILAEVKPPLNNQDYSTYISQIRASKPEAIYFFLSGTDANNFFTQAKQVDLFANIKVTGAGFGVEQDVTQAIGDKSPVGAITGLHWAYTLDNKENKDFTTAYKSKYGRLADVFAMQGYDTARVIIEALNAVKGKTEDKQAFLKAIAAVKFKSPRGDFRFDPATNNVVNPIYIRELVKDPSLGYVNKVKTTVASVADPGQ